VENLRQEYAEKAAEYEARYQESLNPPPLKPHPEWRDIVYHHYSRLRREKDETQ